MDSPTYHSVRSASRTALVAVALLLVWLPATSAQQERTLTLTLSLSEDASGRPLPGARVQISGVKETAVTDPQGRARIRGIPPGQHLLSITRPGYAPEQITLIFEKEDVEAEIAMLVQPVEVEGVTVTSWGRNRVLRDNGFYNRQRIGMGTFLDRDAIERRHAMNTLELFRTVRGFRVGVDQHGRPVVVGRLRCEPDFYLDGMIASKHRAEGKGRLPPSQASPLDIVSPEQIEAIEAYPSPASIPPQYNVTGSACGVILIWTRTGG